jgi:hypothetical protein
MTQYLTPKVRGLPKLAAEGIGALFRTVGPDLCGARREA